MGEIADRKNAILIAASVFMVADCFRLSQPHEDESSYASWLAFDDDDYVSAVLRAKKLLTVLEAVEADERAKVATAKRPASDRN